MDALPNQTVPLRGDSTRSRNMTKRDYYNICRDMARTRRGMEFLHGCLRDPSPRMRPIHLLIIRAAIRDIHPRQSI